ncbi:MAG: nucleoside phosphorylase [Candidatus Hodarchaeales archaeon]
MSKQYHINVSKEDLNGAEHIIICGDPKRVPTIARHLQQAEEISFNREYRVWIGYLDSKTPIIVSSTGIGSPSTAIGIEEFGILGIKTFIRVGTSGIISPKVNLGDVVSAIGAIRDEGTSKQYIDEVFPAVASPDVVLALRSAAVNLGLSDRYHEGIVHSKDAFYSEKPEMIPLPGTESRWTMWKKGGTLVTEMECSILFTICQIRGWKAGSVLAAIGKTDEGNLIIDSSAGQAEAIKVAIEALNILTKK